MTRHRIDPRRQRLAELRGAALRTVRRGTRFGEASVASASWPMLALGVAVFPFALLALIAVLSLGALVGAVLLFEGGLARKLRRRVQADGRARSVVSRIGARDYRIASDDNYLDKIEGVFEPDMVALFDTLVGPRDTVLDIGANIGCTAILFGTLAREVFAFEPSPTTFGFLEQNLRRADLATVRAFNLGLGSTAGSFELTFAPQNRSGGFVSNQTQASNGHQVERIAIVNGDAWVAGQGIGPIHFIKIDVEGFERDVLTGLAATLARDQPVVALELNHWCLNGLQRISVPAFFDFLRGVFPILYAIDGKDVRDLHDSNQAYHVMHEHITRGLKYQNLVGAFHQEQLRRFKLAYELD